MGLVDILIPIRNEDSSYGWDYSDYVIEDVHGSDIISIMVISVRGICSISLSFSLI